MVILSGRDVEREIWENQDGETQTHQPKSSAPRGDQHPSIPGGLDPPLGGGGVNIAVQKKAPPGISIRPHPPTKGETWAGVGRHRQSSRGPCPGQRSPSPCCGRRPRWGGGSRWPARTRGSPSGCSPGPPPAPAPAMMAGPVKCYVTTAFGAHQMLWPALTKCGLAPPGLSHHLPFLLPFLLRPLDLRPEALHVMGHNHRPGQRDRSQTVAAQHRSPPEKRRRTAIQWRPGGRFPN